MDKITVSPKQYQEVVERYREHCGYDAMSGDEQAAFDNKLDQCIEIDWNGEDPDGTDGTDTPDSMPSDRVALRHKVEQYYDYDNMTNGEKERFDRAFDTAYSEQMQDTVDNFDLNNDFEPDDIDQALDSDGPSFGGR